MFELDGWVAPPGVCVAAAGDGLAAGDGPADWACRFMTGVRIWVTSGVESWVLILYSCDGPLGLVPYGWGALVGPPVAMGLARVVSFMGWAMVPNETAESFLSVSSSKNSRKVTSPLS
jgi:hypothetical protein